MQLVGHSDERTHDSYTHVLPDIEVKIAKRLVGVFARPAEEQVE